MSSKTIPDEVNDVSAKRNLKINLSNSSEGSADSYLSDASCVRNITVDVEAFLSPGAGSSSNNPWGASAPCNQLATASSSSSQRPIVYSEQGTAVPAQACGSQSGITSHEEVSQALSTSSLALVEESLLEDVRKLNVASSQEGTQFINNVTPGLSNKAKKRKAVELSRQGKAWWTVYEWGHEQS